MVQNSQLKSENWATDRLNAAGREIGRGAYIAIDADQLNLAEKALSWIELKQRKKHVQFKCATPF
jgi:hypothetical protein